jgi:hypothetical protein
MTFRRWLAIAATSSLALLSCLGLPGATASAAGSPGIPYTFGDNAVGQLGDGSTSPHDTAQPVALNDITGSTVDVSMSLRCDRTERWSPGAITSTGSSGSG